MTDVDPESKVTLRPATPDDVPFLREMSYEVAFAAEEATEEAPPSPEKALQIPWVQALSEDWGRDGDYGLIAINEANERVGAAWYRDYSRDEGAPPYELSVAVRKGDRGKSIGETLLENLLAHADSEGITAIGLQVGANNPAAQELYKKWGFLVVGGEDKYENYKMVGPTSEASAAAVAQIAHGGGCGDKQPQEPDNPGDYFDAFAPLHDGYAEASDMPAKVDHFMQGAIEFAGSGNIQSVLDLGAGTGLSIDAIRRHSQPSRIVAADISAGMLAFLQEKYNDPSLIKTVVASIEDYIPSCNERFDLISSIAALEFVQDLPRVLREVPRLLNRNGLFAATYVPYVEGDERVHVTASPYLREELTKYSWLQGDIEDALTDSGLEIVHRDNSLPAYPLGDDWVYYNFVVARKP